MMREDGMIFLRSILMIFFVGFVHAHNDAWNGNAYHHNSSPQYITARTVLKDVHFNGDEYVLDIGCGSGDITSYVGHCLPNGLVIGIDSSESMIAFASATHGCQNCIFKNVSAQDFEFPAEYFDYVISFSCLHWVKDLKKVLQNIKFVLKPQGKFVGNIAHTGHFFYEPVMQTVQSEKWRSYFNNFHEKPWHAHNPTTFAKLLHEVGLKPLRLNEWYKKGSFATKDAFVAFIKNWIYAIPHMSVLPPEKHEEFIDDAIERFLATVTFEQDGSFSCEAPIFSFEVMKK